MTDLNTLMTLANNAYNDGKTTNPDGSVRDNSTQPVGSYVPVAPQGTVDPDTGFSARSHYSATDKTLVITFTGTNGDDNATNALLANGTHTDLIAQFQQAVNYAQAQIAAAQALYGDDVEIVFTGHSLGGALATHAQIRLDTGSATVFNAPGFGGIGGYGYYDSYPDGSLVTDAPVKYIYSDPSTWEDNLKFAGLADSTDVHNLGGRVSDDIWFLMDANSHGMNVNENGDYVGQAGLLAAYSAGDQLVSLDQLLDIWAQEIQDAGDPYAIHNKAFVEAINKYKLPDYRAEATQRALGDHCFPAGTLITLADGTTKVIEDIAVGDVVMSFGADGVLRPAPVTQLLDNVTTEWLKLSNGTVVTPGHRYLRPDGSFAEIKEIIADDGRIVAEDGEVMAVTAEAIHYSADTAHLFERAA